MPRKRLDPYEWSKTRIKALYSNVAGWEDDVFDDTAKHDIWSIKKLIALSYYIGPFVKIMRKNDFKRLSYVDPFSGSGLIRLMKKYRFPGSPLIPLSRFSESPFDDYLLSDINTDYVSILQKRVNRICEGRAVNVSVSQNSCAESVRKVFSGTKPASWKSQGYLVFLDSYGFEVDWNSMQRILSSGPVDVIFTFMTWAVTWNKEIEKSEAKLNKFFGDTKWRNLNTGDDLLSYYRSKIESLGYLPKYKTYSIDVLQDGGRKYHLILASQSEGAGNVFSDLQNRVKAIDLKMLRDAFSVAVGDQKDLDSYG
jgi:three-Cys-motif partner protein